MDSEKLSPLATRQGIGRSGSGLPAKTDRSFLKRGTVAGFTDFGLRVMWLRLSCF
jgi:hypothetical protein